MKKSKIIIFALLLFGIISIGVGVYLSYQPKKTTTKDSPLVESTDENIFYLNNRIMDYQTLKHCEGCTFEEVVFQKYQRTDDKYIEINNFLEKVNQKIEEIYVESANSPGCQQSDVTYLHAIQPQFTIYIYENSNIFSFTMFVGKINKCDNTYEETLEEYFIYNKKTKKEITKDNNIMEILGVDQSKLDKIVKKEINTLHKEEILKNSYNHYNQKDLIEYYPYYNNDGDLYVSFKVNGENTNYYLVIMD